MGCAGLRCPARLICPADPGLIGCAGRSYPARLIGSADAGLIGCAGPRCPAGLIGPARLISCAGLGCPTRLICPLSMQWATPVQSKTYAQGCHRERERFEGFCPRHCSLLLSKGSVSSDRVIGFFCRLAQTVCFHRLRARGIAKFKDGVEKLRRGRHRLVAMIDPD